MTTSQTRSQSPVRAESAEHEHTWSTESRHPTSSGDVLYVRCGICGIRRVDLQSRLDTPPAPLSRMVGVASDVAR
ncbi:hypothetical protein KCQ71_21965 [Ruania sp. N2-46]|uniref:Uncharacterized protein n=2 Tax=Occultella gossypii TaxID=2800820 RepID=A0ABS7SER3_9MICO|nr:hypothetical protein [Occultella gossypii]